MIEAEARKPVWLEHETILDKRTWVYYLIILDKAVRQFEKHIKVRPDADFYKAVDKHARAFVQDGIMPPEEIAAAIYNIADDYLSNRDITLKTGDYISLQNYIRK